MSRFSRVSTRGASVLAALVLAAFLASVALLVQQGSPIAFSQKPQSQQAQAANTTSASQNQSSSTTDCNAAPNLGYDIKLHADGSLEKVTVCTMHNLKSSAAGTKKYPSQPTQADFGSDAGRCIGQRSTLPSSDWRCIISTCKLQTVSVGRAAYNTEVCQYAYNDAGAAKNDSPAAGGAASGSPTAADIARAAVDGDPAAQQKVQDLLKTDPSFNQTMADAYSDKEQDIQDELQQVTDKYGDIQNQLLNSGCLNGSSSAQCADLSAQGAALEKQGNDLNQQYQDLTATEKKLTPDLCGSAGGCGATPPPGTTPPGGPGSPYPDQSKPQTGFGQRPPMGGPGGGGQPYPPQQQQCQPQYFCNGNTVMYAQCYNQQPGNAQPVQQCQQGYACQQNSCQPQAQYGFCADGRTPRQAPAQPKPDASTCTVGLWQDTSNGCQTSWQCVPSGGNGGTGNQPSAQLSCQPLSAISGSTVSFSYACAGGATDIAASGFSITPTTLAGNATTTIQKPAGGNSVTYSLSCINKSVTPAATASAQCTVQVGNASIVLVATPNTVSQAETDTTKKQSTIGWVTSGMQSCTIANPDFSDWTTQQAGNTSVAGAATSPVISTTTAFTLTCTTLGGTTASSTVRVSSTQ